MALTRFGRSRVLAVSLGGVLFAATVGGTATAQEAIAPSEFEIRVTAALVEDDAPAEVEATEVQLDARGRLSHAVAVTWRDSGEAVLGDERFTHRASSQYGDGELVIAGRGCGVEWNGQDVLHPCTADLQIIPVSQGDTHEYPVWIHPTIGPLQLEPGTYEVKQAIHWWRPGAEDVQQQFTVHLTYEVAERQPPGQVAVEAQVLEADAPVTVTTTLPLPNEDGWQHGVLVTWDGPAATLDDARFTHVDDNLITAGRGCGVAWDDEAGRIVHHCTDDLQFVDLAPGEMHEYPVQVYRSLDALYLALGTYAVEEAIGWSPEAGGPRQEFTVRLTYTVTEGEFGTLTPEPAASGVTTAVWSGGLVTDLPAATSYWVVVDGDLIAYVPQAPAFVNARFFEAFPAALPPDTVLLVVR